MANNWICPKISMKRKIHSYHICMKISSYVLKFSICHTFKVDDEERIPACMRSSPGGSWPSLSCWLCVSDINTTRMLPMENVLKSIKSVIEKISCWSCVSGINTTRVLPMENVYLSIKSVIEKKDYCNQFNIEEENLVNITTALFMLWNFFYISNATHCIVYFTLSEISNSTNPFAIRALSSA